MKIVVLQTHIVLFLQLSKLSFIKINFQNFVFLKTIVDFSDSS